MCYESLGEEEAARDAYKFALNANPHLSRIRKKIENLQEQVRRENIHYNDNILKNGTNYPIIYVFLLNFDLVGI